MLRSLKKPDQLVLKRGVLYGREDWKAEEETVGKLADMKAGECGRCSARAKAMRARRTLCRLQLSRSRRRVGAGGLGVVLQRHSWVTALQ